MTIECVQYVKNCYILKKTNIYFIKLWFKQLEDIHFNISMVKYERGRYFSLFIT
jgi:hypothetical protein